MKLSGMKKIYRYEEEKFLRTIQKMNRSRGFYIGDYTGINKIHFFYSGSEVLYGAKEEYQRACGKYGVSCEIDEKPNMIHCYCMLPYFPETKETLGKIVEILRE